MLTAITVTKNMGCLPYEVMAKNRHCFVVVLKKPGKVLPAYTKYENLE